MREEAQRLQRLPAYVFSELDKIKAEKRAQGVDFIDLGMGSPDLPPPPPIIDAMIEAIRKPDTHRYPTFDGMPEFRKAVVDFCHRQYGISIDQKNEVVPLIGSKEGVVHFTWAFVNPGDTILTPSPAYPAHFRATILADGIPIIIPTTERANYVPDLDRIDPKIARHARMLILSYPTNPTGATVDLKFFEHAVEFAKKYDLVLVHDFAYAEIYFEGKKPPSIFQVKGAKDIAIEFHSLSKTFSMAGWRCGFAVGNARLIEILGRIKTNLDYGLFLAVQHAAVAALNLKDGYIDRTREIYQRRRDLFVDGLNSLGWKVKRPKATFYIWAPVPQGFNSTNFTLELINQAGVVASPGIAFGDLGEGYVRFALIQTEDKLHEAIERMRKAGIKYHGS